jgi:acetyl esterase/lipase
LVRTPSVPLDEVKEFMRGRCLALAAWALSGIVLACAAPVAAQTCQTFSGLTYATYLDRFGVSQDLKLELMVPVVPAGAPAPVPLVIYVHGGGWKSGSRLPIPARVSGFCSQGYAVASLDYRLSTVAVWPAQLHDVKGAVRWLRANAAAYGLDPDRFAAWGESAGGHLAMLLGTTGGLGTLGTVTVGNVALDLEGTTGGAPAVSSRVQAVIDGYGATDFLQMRFYPTSDHDASTSDESRLLGGAVQTLPERAATANPITWVSPDDPPFLVLHGTVDKVNPFNQAQLLVEALWAKGVPVTFRPVLNAAHGGTAFESAAVLQTMRDFLAATLRDLPARTVRVVAMDDAGEDGGEGAFTLERTGGDLAAGLTVRWTAAGTARAGVDYEPLAGTAVLPAGVSSVVVPVTPIDDTLVEGNESLVIELVPDPAYRIAADGAAAVVKIADDDPAAGLPLVTVTATDPSAAETGGAGVQLGRFTVTRGGTVGANASALTVGYALTGTAKPGADFAAPSGSVTIPAGQASAVVDVTAYDDAAVERTETVILTLQAGESFQVGSPAAASVAITDTDFDPAAATVSVVAADPDAAEPSSPGSFLIWRRGSLTAPLTVEISAGGTASGGTDYAAMPATVTFSAGAERVSVDLLPVDDFQTEAPETATLAVAPAAGIALAPHPGGAVTLADDDPAGAPDVASVTLSPSSLLGTQPATGTVTLTAPVPAAIAAGLRVGLASGNAGVASVPASLVVPAGQSSATFTVTTQAVATTTPVYVSAFRQTTRSATLTVQAPAVSGFTLSPASFAPACQASSGRVTISGKAPAGGLTVPLTSTHPTAVVPASVTVPAGATSVTFPVTAPAASSTQSGVLTAAYGGGSRSATLTTRPVAAAALDVSPNPATGPATATATVTLDCAAPSDVTVALSSSKPSVAQPAVPSIVIPAGQSSGTFQVTVYQVAAATSVSIRATAGGVQKSRTLTVQP